MLELQQSLGLAYLFISHDMAVVEEIAHRVAVMRKGRIVEVPPKSTWQIEMRMGRLNAYDTTDMAARLDRIAGRV